MGPSKIQVNQPQGLIEEESAFLQFMKRVERELNQAQSYLYNVTDNTFGTNLSERKPEKKPSSTPNKNPSVNTNTRFAPITLEVNDNNNSPAPAPSPAKEESVSN